MMDARTHVRDDAAREAEVNERFQCDHGGWMRLTVFTDALVRTHLRRQCSRCGVWSGVKKAAVPEAEEAAAVAFDPQIGDDWNQRRYRYGRELFEADRAAVRAESLDGFRDEEAEFLESDEWARMRTLVLRRAGGVCEGCLVRQAVQVHHTNYVRKFGREMLFDLRAVCRECHEAIHNPADRRTQA